MSVNIGRFIRICGIMFDSEEIIDLNKIYKNYPQNVSVEKLGVPLRATTGMQAVYNKFTMDFIGLTFYAPTDKKYKLYDTLKYVLASGDGVVKQIKEDLVLLTQNLTIAYSDITILKTGFVKKGQIIGIVKPIEQYGYGVTMKAYNGNSNLQSNGNIVNLTDYFYNIPFIE